MKIKFALSCVVLALAAMGVAADEPTRISGVKTLVIRDSSPSKGSAMCIASLEARLTEKGFAVVETSDRADAEIMMTLAFAGWRVWSGAFNRPANLTYVVTVKTLPDHRQLFSLQDDDSDDLGEACQTLAKKIVKRLLPGKGKK